MTKHILSARNRPLLATIEAGDPTRFRPRTVETERRKLRGSRARRKQQERRDNAR